MRQKERIEQSFDDETAQHAKKGVVKFKYEKKDGTIRTAEGTLKKSLIPEIDKDGGAEEDFPKDCFGYYDLGKDDWRMFIRKNFLDSIEDKNKK